MSRKARMFITDKFDIYKFDNNSFADCGGCSFRGLRVAVYGVSDLQRLRLVAFVVCRGCGFRGLRFAGFASAVFGGCG